MKSLLLFWLFLFYPTLAWLSTLGIKRNATRRDSKVSPSFALTEGYQECGEKIIREAWETFDTQERENLTIEWKVGRIIVTVRGSVYVSSPDENEDSVPTEENIEKPASGVDITALARSINHALGEDEVGLEIAENYEIEVTTPGASDELYGIMFESYKGFDVICRYEDPKAKKGTKEIQGRLVERNDQVTIINMKGRMKKIKNDSVVFVKLPKAKKEKGVN